MPANIFSAFVCKTLLSIADFLLPLGAMLAYSLDEHASLNPLLGVFRKVNETLEHVAHDILRFTTVAVLTVLAGSLAS